MANVGEVYARAAEIASGPRVASVKLALWAALLSAQTGLAENARQVETLRRYVDRGLPRNPNKLWREMEGAQNFTHVKLLGLYHIEALERHDKLAGLESIGATLVEQKEWRDKVHRLVRRHGMAWKTVSFAAFLLSPTTCELVPIDRHHLHLRGFQCNSVRSKKRYTAVENIIQLERDLYLAGHPAAIYAWLTWDSYRMQTGANTTGRIESHAGLNCRVY